MTVVHLVWQTIIRNNTCNLQKCLKKYQYLVKTANCKTTLFCPPTQENLKNNFLSVPQCKNDALHQYKVFHSLQMTQSQTVFLKLLHSYLLPQSTAVQAAHPLMENKQHINTLQFPPGHKLYHLNSSAASPQLDSSPAAAKNIFVLTEVSNDL